MEVARVLMAKDDGISLKNEKMEGLCAVAGPRGDMGGGVSTPPPLF